MKLPALLPLIVGVLLAACGPTKTPVLTKVFVESASYRLGSAEYRSTSELVAALKATPHLEAIYLIPSQGLPPERVTETVQAIQAAGITASIGMVGNEVFNK